MAAWKLYHQGNRQSYDFESAEQAVSFLSAFVEAQASPHWFAWTAGWSSWKPVKEVTELFPQAPALPTGAQPPRHAPPPLPPPPLGALPVEPPADRRKDPRIKLTLKVVIIDLKTSKAFRSTTTNVSLGGAMLEHEIPSALSGAVCEIFLSSENDVRTIGMSGKALVDPRSSRRLMFTTMDELTQTRLADWLEAGNLIPKRQAA